MYGRRFLNRITMSTILNKIKVEKFNKIFFNLHLFRMNKNINYFSTEKEND